MKMKRMVSMLLVLAAVIGLLGMPVNAGYTCHGYDECTASGDIYIVSKDNAPVRKEHNNNGEILARLHKGDLVSVKRVFWTFRASRWCELAIGDETAYIYIENVKPHTEHSWIPVVYNETGACFMCGVCTLSVVSTKDATATCDLKCIAEYAVKGSFYTETTPSFIAILAQILIGEIPGVGTVADVRDLIGDIATGQEAWVVGLDALALLPLIGAFKYADDVAAIKYVDDVDDLTDIAKNADLLKHMDVIPWGTWDDYAKVTKNSETYACIGDFLYTKHAVEEFMNPSWQTNLISSVGGGLVEHSRGIPPQYVNWILTEGVENGTTWVEKLDGDKITYVNGTLKVVYDKARNLVITIAAR